MIDRSESRAWGAVWQGLSEQWARSRFVRVGALLGCLILCAEALVRMGVWSSELSDRARELTASNRSEQVLLREVNWASRKDQAARQWAALESMLWEAPDNALVQASIQDALRGMSNRAGLPIRELSVSQQVPGKVRPSPVDRGAPLESGALPGAPGEVWSTARLDALGVGHWSVRMTLEFRRVPVMSFLNELAAYERALVVERLEIKIAQTPAVVELELRAFSRMPRSTPSRSAGS
jgi:hypothetical protein